MHSKFENNRMNTFEMMSNLRWKVRMVGTKTATSFIMSYDDFTKRVAIAIQLNCTCCFHYSDHFNLVIFRSKKS